MTARRHQMQRGLLIALGGALAAYLVVPILALLMTTTWSDLSRGLSYSLVWPALRLSLMTTSCTLGLLVLLGTPLAWVVSRSDTRLARAVETALKLPIVIPPAVAGVALLLAFGRRGLLTGRLYPESWNVAFTTTAVIMAELFVAAPFFVQAAISAFRRVDPRLVIVSRTFGASPFRIFFQLAIPIAAPGLATGAAMSWARAVGEFGATLMFAGNLEGQTQTVPLAIYTALELDMSAARAMSILLVLVAFGLLAVVRAIASRSAETATGPH